MFLSIKVALKFSRGEESLFWIAKAWLHFSNSCCIRLCIFVTVVLYIQESFTYEDQPARNFVMMWYPCTTFVQSQLIVLLCTERPWRPDNAYLKAVLAEDQYREGADSEAQDDDGYSDLEDFIVCKPERDYNSLLAKEFRYCADDCWSFGLCRLLLMFKWCLTM